MFAEGTGAGVESFGEEGGCDVRGEQVDVLGGAVDDAVLADCSGAGEGEPLLAHRVEHDARRSALVFLGR